MIIRSINCLIVNILLLLGFWASQTSLIVCTTTSLIQLLANSTKEDFRLAKRDSTNTQNDLSLIKRKVPEGSTVEEGISILTEENSSIAKWDGHQGQEKGLMYSHIFKPKELLMSNNFSIQNERKSFKLSKPYGRILSTTYTKENVKGWWPWMGMKDEEVNLNVSCTTCNISSNGGRKKKAKSLLSRLYEKLFVMTHARLHPTHHRPVRVIVVDQRGHGNSRTVQGAIDMVRLDNKWRIQIIIRPGIYREKVYVPYRKPFITFQGSGSGITVITWNARASDRSHGGEILGTFGSASVAIDSDYFVARDITFQNTSPPPLPGAQGMQAVALRISGDKAAFIDCRMLGAQDTLFDHVGRHFFLRCYIEGAIDFIFGDGRSLYLNCELHANAVTYGAIAASQRNSPSDNTGFSFVQCKITGTGLLYLGRAWGQYARILFAFSYFENIIIPDGWYDWGDTSRRETVFFGEYKCWGPGSQAHWRVSWSRQLSFQEARPFLSLGFINGHKWLNILA